MTNTKRFSPEVRERAVRLVFSQEQEHSSQWACIEAIAPKIGCTPQTLRTWVKQAEIDQGRVVEQKVGKTSEIDLGNHGTTT
jgi:transposase-like protein